MHKNNKNPSMFGKYLSGIDNTLFVFDVTLNKDKPTPINKAKKTSR